MHVKQAVKCTEPHVKPSSANSRASSLFLSDAKEVHKSNAAKIKFSMQLTENNSCFVVAASVISCFVFILCCRFSYMACSDVYARPQLKKKTTNAKSSPADSVGTVEGEVDEGPHVWSNFTQFAVYF